MIEIELPILIIFYLSRCYRLESHFHTSLQRKKEIPSLPQGLQLRFEYNASKKVGTVILLTVTQ